MSAIVATSVDYLNMESLQRHVHQMRRESILRNCPLTKVQIFNNLFRGLRLACDASEFQRIRKLAALTDEEIRDVKNRRHVLEQRIVGDKVAASDFHDYIQLESDHLLSLGNFMGDGELQRLHNLKLQHIYEHANLMCPSDVKFMYFMLDLYKKDRPSELVEFIRSIHNIALRNPVIVKMTATLAYFTCHEADLALRILMLGISHNPFYRSQLILYFDILLREASKNQGKMSNYSLDLVTLYNDDFPLQRCDFAFLVKLMSVCERSPSAVSQRLQLSILVIFDKYFPHEPLVYHLKALRELRGFHTGHALKRLPLQAKLSTYQKMNNCLMMYFKGMEKMYHITMWEYYLTTAFLLFCQSENSSVIKDAMYSCLFNRIGVIRMIGLANHKRMAKRLSDNNITTDTTAGMAYFVRRHKKDVNAWGLFMALQMNKNIEHMVLAVFEVGCFELSSHETLLFDLLLEFYLERREYTCVEEIYRALAINPQMIRFTGDYVQWAADQRGYDAARIVYRRLDHRSSEVANCLTLYRKLIALENTRTPLDRKFLVRIHETCASNFGKTDQQVWLDFMAFALPEHRKRLCIRAGYTLQANSRELRAFFNDMLQYEF